MGLVGLVWAWPALALCPKDVGDAIAPVTTSPELRPAHLGIAVETLAGEVIYHQDAEQFFIPASNVKLFTTAAALHHLGPTYRIRTSLYGRVQQGLTSLRVVGRGDPTLGPQQLRTLARQLHGQGIRRVSQLLADDSYFQEPAVHPNWEWEDVQAAYGAPVNGLILNENAVTLTLTPTAPGHPLGISWSDPTAVDSWSIRNSTTTATADEAATVGVERALAAATLYLRGQLPQGGAPDTTDLAIPDPGRYFLEHLRQALLETGIAVGATTLTREPVALEDSELAWVESPPLATLLVPTNRDSHNLYAEVLFKTLGATQAVPSETAIENILATLGIAPEQIVLVDGSGLSRHNLATPQALVDVLQIMHGHPQGRVLRQSLAVAGRSGTLRHRFGQTPVANRFYGKTGAVTNNFSLSGYLYPPDHEPLVVSLIINHADHPGRVLRPLIDRIVITLAQLQPC
ncbi:D-alanyl-D-alanine carboxypeptidase [Halomicronema hongdechloris C2206]|uniref:D-alanyl-D-alanine carboxypeptidase n=2 Tax=Halomicronema hongdechloris TaxID=1209493 RepID=A0A1Z3HLR0_9CYAN|nr:D-alanyl-D-alanine carboxypeptidase [Halomicronema hongdechloris C2206]